MLLASLSKKLVTKDTVFQQIRGSIRVPAHRANRHSKACNGTAVWSEKLGCVEDAVGVLVWGVCGSFCVRHMVVTLYVAAWVYLVCTRVTCACVRLHFQRCGGCVSGVCVFAV